MMNRAKDVTAREDFVIIKEKKKGERKCLG